MVDVMRLLIRLLQIVGDSDDYFVSGSLSFLPLLGNCRKPQHDVDAAIAHDLFARRAHLLRPTEHIRWLPLSQVALAGPSRLARALSPATSFAHIDGPEGLLDLACYGLEPRGLIFRLGAGITLEIPIESRSRMHILVWDGISFQAGPPELAYIPKAAQCLRTRPILKSLGPIERKCLEDLRHLSKVVDWTFLRQLLESGGLRWLGGRLPTFLMRLYRSICSSRNYCAGRRGDQLVFIETLWESMPEEAMIERLTAT